MERNTADTACEVDGVLLQAVVDGVKDATGYFEKRTRRQLTDHGLPATPTRGETYSLDRFLDLLETIERGTGPNTVNRIGQAVPKALTWPTSVTDVPGALSELGTAMQRLHTQSTGSYRFVRTGHGTGRIHSSAPYPEAFECGLIEGIGRLFGPGTGYVSVERLDSATGERTYEVTWLTETRETTSIAVTDTPPTTAEQGRSGVAGD